MMKFLNSKLEEAVLQFWQEKEIFAKSLQKKAPKGDYVFYDGPPFATGTPHYGHIVASLMKDVVPRFWTMRGYRVERVWGWDCHGLPIENIVEQELQVRSKKEIEEKIGVDKFNAICQSKVLMYADEWKKFIPRMGRWVDMEHAYKTMDLDYMESIWWVFKQLWDKGLIYEGYKSLHICPRCETTLSQSEVSQGYKDIRDISVVVKFKIQNSKFKIHVLAWTTTPWTLAGNVALAVGEKISYLKVKIDSDYYILAEETAARILKDKKYQVVEELKGKDLVGQSYEPLFPYFATAKNREKGFKIYPADFVATEEGTGVVHIAPAFGEDDLNLGKKYGLPFIQHVDFSGRFTEEVTDFAGEIVKPTKNPQATDRKIVAWLEEKQKLFNQEECLHSYPHCWRCDTPLLNYATSSWFVKVTSLKERMIKLAKKINWIPRHIKEGRFGKWLQGAEDWSISRQRFWGSVLPIWQCSCGERKVFGSRQELEKVSGQKINDLHKHMMDKITFPCSRCGRPMRRIPDVLDCWFESGSMPYTQRESPAQFIAEGVDQTRCWFYYLHVLSTAIMNNIAFKNVIANGIVLAEDGQKMSKHLKNYPDPNEIINKYGADALRYYLLTSPVMKAETLLFSEKGVDEVFKKLILLLGNVFSFYKIYARQEIKAKNDSKNILDQWIIARLHSLVKEVTKQMEAYDLVSASRPIIEFVSDLSTWYLRRSRDRFKTNNQTALQTMKYILLNLTKIMAPFTPFVAEYIYQEVGKEKESVHLEDWPKAGRINRNILKKMQQVREMAEKALAKRAEAGIKIRQPLANLMINLKLPQSYLDILAEEVNVKEIKVGKKFQLNTKISAELKEEGLVREIIRQINALRKEMKLTIKDKIIIDYKTTDKIIKEIFNKYQKEICQKTIATKIKEGEAARKISDLPLWLQPTKL